MTYGGGSQGSYFSYDQLGRITLKYQRTGTTNYQIQASYNKAGAVTSQTYPSGRVVTYNYYGEAGFGAGMQKPAGRLAKFSGNLGDGLQRTYSEQVLYTAAGQLTQEQFVTNTRLYHNRHFTNRGLLYDVRLGTGTGVDGQTAEWTWNRGAIRLFYSSDYTYHFIPDNEAASNWAMPIDYYWYDSLNRLQGVTEVSDSYQNGVYQSLTSFSQQFVYDRYGNRTINQTATWGLGINKKDFTVNTANNRLGVPGGQSGVMQFDAVGNLINDTYTGQGSRSYDAENRMVSAVGSNGSNSYGYDGEGKRVKRILPGQEWWQVYGIGGELIAEYLSTQPTVVSKEYGYRNGELLIVGGCDVARWMVSDHLGTPRIEADVTGSLAGIKRHDYLPFGEELVAGMGDNSVQTGARGYSVDCMRQRFGAKERDTETGLDFFGARYLASVQGRFTSPDPLLSSGTIYDPQSWNRYTYTLNNPLKYTDPFGLFIWSDSLGGNVTDEELRRRAGNDKKALKEANKIIAQRQAFRDALTEASRAANSSNLTADQRAQISESLASYGAEGTDNGVSVGTGRLADGVAAEARTAYFPFDTNNNTFTARVEVVLNDRRTGNLAIDVAHEGRHVADAQAFAGALTADLANQGLNAIAGPLNRTRYEREVRAYLVSSYAAQGLGLPNLSFGGREVWNSGWRAVERAELRSRGIETHLRESATYRLTPQNPGERYIPRN